MDSMDAATKLQQEFGSDFVQWSDARKAVEMETDDIIRDNKRMKYPDAVQEAYERVSGWIRGAHEFTITRSWLSIASFHASHRHAGTWAVLIGQAIIEAREEKERSQTQEVQP